MSDITIRPLSFEDIDTVIALKKNIVQQPHFNSRIEKAIYEWELIRNPYRRENFPIGFVLEHKTEIIGSVVLVPANFKIGKENIYACFEVDLMVNPNFRFHGLKLVNKVWNENIFPLVISTTPNKTSFEIERRMGAMGISFTAHKYVKIINLLQPLIKGKNLNLKKLVIWANSSIRSIIRKPRETEDFRVEQIAVFDRRFDQLYTEVSKDYSSLHIRNSLYLNWRYIYFPFGERKIFSILNKETILRGFIVIQKEETDKGIKRINILDLFTRKNDFNATQALLAIVIDYAKNEKFDRVEILPTNINLENILSNAGFIKRELNFPLCSYRCSKSELSKITENMANWFISSGEGDTSTLSALYWFREFKDTIGNN